MIEERQADRFDWPPGLSSYVHGDHVRVTTSGPHPYVWVAVPIALVLGALGLAGIGNVGTGGLVSLITGLGAMVFAAAILTSTAYSIWGSLEITHRGAGWIVTRRLGPLKAASAFNVSSVRSAELYSPPPYVILWPGGAGLHVRLQLKDRDRPVEVGAGLRLDGEVLRGLRSLFAPTP